jgi:hypothetical protein
MDSTRGPLLPQPAWRRCIENGDFEGLWRIVSKRGFDFQQKGPRFLNEPYSYFVHGQDEVTPLGKAMCSGQYWAVQMLLEAGANPDAFCSWFIPYGTLPTKWQHRPIELCITSAYIAAFLCCLLHHGASVCFVLSSSGVHFLEHCEKNIIRCDPGHLQIIRTAHARELRAYTAVWCANHAGGSWPDMAMLLQAVIMKDELLCERVPVSKKQRN